VLSEWARRFGMEATFDSDVPDLEAGEFLVYLPDAGAVSSLDVSLQSMCLRARRKGRSVRIWLDGNLQEDASDAAMVAKGQTPEARLEAFLDAYTPGKGGLSPLFGILVDAPEMGGSRYTPRIQRAQWLDESRLEAPELDSSRPLGSQLHLLGPKGLKVQTKGGVLLISPIQ